ncbi:MAG: DUF2877 domain-containing protein [Alphaproteobacteria bacterium]|nr:DUF2877 domain-containing protein [Alphaproteobacteria bacterium]
MSHHFRLLSCGTIGGRVLRAGTTGTVAAVFSSSFYLESEGRFVCIGTETLGLGPLNAICDAPGKTDWLASGLRDGTPFIAIDRSVRIRGSFAFETAAMESWHPRPYPEAPHPADLRRNLQELRRVMAARLPDQGLAHCVLGGQNRRPTTPLAKAARGPIEELRTWLEMALARSPNHDPYPPPAMDALAGLGPGLTPSGDDFLGGTILALDAVGADAARTRLAASACDDVHRAGNRISTAHVRAAAEGYGSAAIHELLGELRAGRTVTYPERLDAIDRIGHCSGWDTLCGVITALDAVVAVSERDGIPARPASTPPIVRP